LALMSWAGSLWNCIRGWRLTPGRGGMQDLVQLRHYSTCRVASNKQQQHLPSPILVSALLACMWLLRLHSPLTQHASYNAQRVAWCIQLLVSSRQAMHASFCFVSGRARHSSLTVRALSRRHPHCRVVSSLSGFRSSWPASVVTLSSQKRSQGVFRRRWSLHTHCYTCGPVRTLQ
jgi:hypothetical protein